MIPSSGCPPWPPDHPRTQSRTGNPTPPPGARPPPGCHVHQGCTLLYVGISPKAPPQNGTPPSRSTLRQRLRTHYAGNAEGSTLRRTLGCLLGEELGIQLRRVGSGTRYTFTNPGEQVLDHWMSDHAYVTWVVSETPWVLEHQFLTSGPRLPLNIEGNPCSVSTGLVSSMRSGAREVANQLEIVVDNGGPRRPARAVAR